VADGDPAAELVHVRILGLPIELVERTRLHYEALRRELTLIALSPPDSKQSLPPGLLAIVEQMNERFSTLTPGEATKIDTARTRGDTTVDLEFDVPRSAGPESAALAALIDDADGFARDGTLLTLAAPPECVAFRRWYLDEFARQVDGHAPIPWGERTVHDAPG
jgi:hypothetical protein